MGKMGPCVGPCSTQLGWMNITVRITSPLLSFHRGGDFQLCSSPQLETLSSKCYLCIDIGTSQQHPEPNFLPTPLLPHTLVFTVILSEAPGSVKCRISKWTNRCAHKGPGILASCFSGVAEAPWPLSGGGWLYMTSGKSAWLLWVSVFASTKWQAGRESHISVSALMFHNASLPSLPWFLPFALFLMHMFSWGTNLTLHLMIYLQRWPIP